MSRREFALVALYAVIVGEPPRPTSEEPLPPADLWRSGPLLPKPVRHAARVRATSVRLNGLGIRTHANWVLFRLPFDATQTDRIDNVQITPSAFAPTDVGTVRLGGLCLTTRHSGSVEHWTMYTATGVGDTQRFRWHPTPPSRDPTILGVNVPTRVANHVACGRDERLREPETWIVDLEWDER